MVKVDVALVNAPAIKHGAVNGNHSIPCLRGVRQAPSLFPYSVTENINLS